MLRELISASLTQGNAEYLELLPKKLLETKDCEVVSWIVNYNRDHSQMPEIDRFKREGDYGFYWIDSLNQTPLADLYEQTRVKLNFDRFAKIFNDANEGYYNGNIFDYKKAQKLMSDLIPPRGVKNEAKSIFSDNLDELFDGNNSMRLPFGVPNLDDFIGGIKVGDYAQVFAPTGIGKTTFLCFYAVRAARGYNKVLFISREVTREALKEKMSAIIGSFDNKLFESVINEDRETLKIHKTRVKAEFEVISFGGGEIKIPEENVFSTDDIENLIREEIRQTGKGFDLVIVDGIYSLSQGGNTFVGGDWTAVRSISIQLMDIAVNPELKVRLIASSQIKPERVSKTHYGFDDIAYCKAITQDASIVFSIAPGCGSPVKLLNSQQLWSFNIMKNRNGPIGFYSSEMMVDHSLSSLSASNGVTFFSNDLSKEPLTIKKVETTDE